MCVELLLGEGEREALSDHCGRRFRLRRGSAYLLGTYLPYKEDMCDMLEDCISSQQEMHTVSPEVLAL